MSSLINKKHLRQFILDYAERQRPGRFTSVSASVYDEAEAALHKWARSKVDTHPSVGKTIK